MEPTSRDLSDERSLRLGLEQRLAREIERTKEWRQRAEERLERIRQLESQGGGEPVPPSAWRRAANLLRRPAAGESPGAAPESAPTPEPPPPPTLPSVSIAAVTGHPAIEAVVAEAHRVDPIADPDATVAADLLVVDSPGWSALPEHERESLTALVRRPGGPPLVVWGDGSPLPDLAAEAQAIVNLTSGPQGTFLPGSYPRRTPRTDGEPVEILQAALTRPSPDLIAAAGAGRGVVIRDEESMDLDRSRLRGLRWAFRHHRPLLRLCQLLDAADVPHPNPDPSVAAILVSNRSELVGPALAALGEQTWRPLGVVVGLHGFTDPGLKAPADDIDLDVFEFDESMTLGECLNRCLAGTGADIVAKIDDDDHYGPAYLEDAVRDLDSSGHDMAGKASVYTYLAESDRTVLRRPGVEHTPIEGILGGNTLVMRRSVWERVPFPHRPRFVDRILMEGARRVGYGLYSGSRFEFCAVRHGRDHTYGASDVLLAAGSEEAWRGLHPERCYVPDLETSPAR